MGERITEGGAEKDRGVLEGEKSRKAVTKPGSQKKKGVYRTNAEKARLRNSRNRRHECCATNQTRMDRGGNQRRG